MAGKHLRVFVATGNSAPFPRLLRGVQAAAREPGLELFAQRGFGGPDFPEIPGADFIAREQFAERLAWADVVVCHAGAGTIYEAHRSGHTPIVVPRLARLHEHVNDHQLELAQALAQQGLAMLCEDVAELNQLMQGTPSRSNARRVGNEQLVGAVREALLFHAGQSLRSKLRSVLHGTWKTLRVAGRIAGTRSRR